MRSLTILYRRPLPVYQPAAQEGFATYGSVDATPVLQGLELPDNVHRTLGQLSIATSSTLLQSLLDSVLVLRDNRGYDYPERLASRLLANLALRDVLYAFAVPNLRCRRCWIAIYKPTPWPCSASRIAMAGFRRGTVAARSLALPQRACHACPDRSPSRRLSGGR